MIIIKTDGFEHKYYGNITIEQDDIFIKITADGDPEKPDLLFKWQKYCIDLYWIEDVESIIGVE